MLRPSDVNAHYPNVLGDTVTLAGKGEAFGYAIVRLPEPEPPKCARPYRVSANV